MILSAFWPFIAWMESTTFLGNSTIIYLKTIRLEYHRWVIAKVAAQGKSRSLRHKGGGVARSCGAARLKCVSLALKVEDYVHVL